VADVGGPYNTLLGATNFDGSASFDPDSSGPLTYDWDFGDGSTHGSGISPSHTYAVESFTMTYTVTLIDNDGTENSAPVSTTVTVPSIGLPIPGQIEAEDYNTGGEGMAYHDTTAGNAGGVYRSDDGDIEVTSDSGGGYNVGWVNSGEWLSYDVTMQSSGNYDLELRVARRLSGNSNLHVEIDGIDISVLITVPKTGGWQSFITVNVPGVVLTEGPHVLTVYFDDGSINLNWLRFTQ
jgi:PKD repeat protein